MSRLDHVEAVYAFIWRYLVEREALPFQYQIAEALGIRREDVGNCVEALRQQERISPTTLLPTAYDAWWREHVRHEQRWTVKPLVPLRRLQEK